MAAVPALEESHVPVATKNWVCEVNGDDAERECLINVRVRASLCATRLLVAQKVNAKKRGKRDEMRC